MSYRPVDICQCEREVRIRRSSFPLIREKSNKSFTQDGRQRCTKMRMRWDDPLDSNLTCDESLKMRMRVYRKKKSEKNKIMIRR